MKLNKNTSRWARCALILTLCTITIAVVKRYEILNNFAILSGDSFDAVISAAILEHWFNVVKGSANWFDVGYFYPYTRTIAQTDAYFLVGLIYAPIRILGVDPFLSQEIAGIALKAIGFWGAYLFAKKIKLPFGHACLLAVLFTLANIINIRPSRIQLATVSFIPVMLCCLLNFWQNLVSANKNKILLWGGCCGLFYGAWALTCFYTAWFFLFVFLLYVVFLWVFMSKAERALVFAYAKNCWPQLLAVICISVVSLFPFIYAFLPKSLEVGVRTYSSASSNTIPVWGLFDLGSSNFMYGSVFKEILSFSGVAYKPMGEYGTMGYGFLLFGLFLAGAYSFFVKKTDEPNVFWKALVAATLLAFIFGLKILGHSAWFFVYHTIPGAKALNVISAIYVVLYFPVAIIAIEFLKKANSNTLLFLLISAMLLLSELSKPDLSLNRRAEIEKISNITPPPECKVFYVSGWEFQKSPALVDNSTIQYYAHNVSAIMIAQMTGIPTINGIASFAPRDWNFAFPYKYDYEQRIADYTNDKEINGLCRLDLNNKTWSIVEDRGVADFTRDIDFRAGRGWSGIIQKVEGLSFREDWGAWSNSDSVNFKFVGPLPGEFDLHLVARAFGPNVDGEFEVSVGADSSKFRLSTNDEERVIKLKNPEGARVVRIKIPNAISPKSLGLSGDDRNLGIGFVEMKIVPSNK
ncbi:MAG: hypothetical protein FWD62_09865 [Betaproteobacteria bacterium]|nr:hypothetical protein [Betaproteobacteria bacterium]